MAALRPQSEKEWEIEQAVETLMKAEEIKADSKLMKLVMARVKKKKQALAKLGVLKG